MKKLTVAFVLLCSLLCIALVGCSKKEKECDHTFGDWKVVTEAVECKTPGLKQKTCTKCKYTVEEAVSEHDFGDWVQLKRATCSEEGTQYHVCKTCNKYVEESTDKLAHSFGEWVIDTPAKCTEIGMRSHTCTLCDEVETEDIPAGHSYSDWDVVREATCTEAGLRVRTCSTCKEAIREAIATHHYGEVEVLKAPVPCNGNAENARNGVGQKTCADCGHVQKVTLYAHDYDAGRLTKSANCLEDGSIVRFCTACKDRLEEIIPAHGHDPDEPIVRQATCDQTGTVRQTCKVKDCRYKSVSTPLLSLTLPATGHSFDESGHCINNHGTEEKPKICGAECGTTLKFEMIDGTYAVVDCTGSVRNVVIPQTYMGVPVTAIADNAFADSKMNTVTVTANVTSIGANAFARCTSLKTLTLSESLLSIGDAAFEGCTSLKTVSLPMSLQTVGNAILKGCTALNTLAVPFIGATADESTNTQFIGYYFGATSYQNQNEVIPTNLKTIQVKGGTKIADYAFNKCESLTAVMIAKSIRSVGTGAFNLCSKFDKIYYEGNEREWNQIVNSMYVLDTKGVYIYSETEPTGEGNYWYLDGTTCKVWEKKVTTSTTN
ncbi:MAG: leucine-rich repeat domain-containing protein [Ruminococcaceae bacterium]|nr:leucine-rich repeat domain-containing protein [Oscillospiraceae bacterium]